MISRLAASTSALAITRLSPVDVKPAADLTSRPIARHISETFDGLEVDLRAYREASGLWVTLRAVEAGEGARRAEAINQKAEGWAFRLTDYDFQDFTPNVLSIVERRLLSRFQLQAETDEWHCHRGQDPAHRPFRELAKIERKTICFVIVHDCARASDVDP